LVLDKAMLRKKDDTKQQQINSPLPATFPSNSDLLSGEDQEFSVSVLVCSQILQEAEILIDFVVVHFQVEELELRSLLYARRPKGTEDFSTVDFQSSQLWGIWEISVVACLHQSSLQDIEMKVLSL
jgi:hypothetical protein